MDGGGDGDVVLALPVGQVSLLVTRASLLILRVSLLAPRVWMLVPLVTFSPLLIVPSWASFSECGDSRLRVKTTYLLPCQYL